MRAARFAIPILAAVTTTPAVAQRGAVEAAIAAARAGGTVIACRHGITNHRDREDELTLRYDDPAMQRRLNADGERQGSAVGQALRALNVPIGEVIASPMQRAWRTAELMAGRRAVRDSAWHTRGDTPTDEQLATRRQALATPPATGNRLIVSHVVTLGSVLKTTGSLEEGDCVVARPTGTGHEVIGPVPWRAWIDAAGAVRR